MSFRDTFHEIKNNLSSLRFSLQLLEYNLDPAKKAQITNNLTKILDKSLNTIEQLSLIERYKEQRWVLQQPISLPKLLAQCAPELSIHPPKKTAYFFSNQRWLLQAFAFLELERFGSVTIWQRGLHHYLFFANKELSKDDQRSILQKMHRRTKPPILYLLERFGISAFEHQEIFILKIPLISPQLRNLFFALTIVGGVVAVHV